MFLKFYQKKPFEKFIKLAQLKRHDLESFGRGHFEAFFYLTTAFKSPEKPPG